MTQYIVRRAQGIRHTERKGRRHLFFQLKDAPREYTPPIPPTEGHDQHYASTHAMSFSMFTLQTVFFVREMLIHSMHATPGTPARDVLSMPIVLSV